MWATDDYSIDIVDGVPVLTADGEPVHSVREDLDELTLALRTRDRVWTQQVLDRLTLEYPEATSALYRGLGLPGPS